MRARSRWIGIWRLVLGGWVALGLLTACGDSDPSKNPPPLAKELILYHWAGYMPQSILDAFNAEYHVKVAYETYQSMEEAVASIRAGKNYDVAVIENQHLLALATDRLLAELDYRNIPNFKNISPNFRDLVFDPDNRHSVPYTWGTTGLLVRSDLVSSPVTRWADLWDPRYAGKIAARPLAVEMIPMVLKSLGYSSSSEDPAHLQAARDRLLALKSALLLAPELDAEQAVARLASGETVMLMGWSGEALYASLHHPAIHYVFPAEGALLWGDSLVVSANSQRKRTAELFVDFLLRPEISAQIVNAYYYASANEAAEPFIKPEIRHNLAILSDRANIDKAEWYRPFSLEREQRFNEIWEQFMTGEAR